MANDMGGKLPPFRDRSTRDRAEDVPTPFSLRLTFEERAALEDAAGDMPLGAYIWGELFKGKKTRTRRRRAARDRLPSQ